MADEIRYLSTQHQFVEECRSRLSEHEQRLASFSTLLEEIRVRVTAMEDQLEQNICNPVSVTSEISTSEGKQAEKFEEIELLPFQSFKLDIPRFDGDDPAGWIFKLERFFNYYDVEESQRLKIASFHLDGVALEWLQWNQKNGLLLNWCQFLDALRLRFGLSKYQDLQMRGFESGLQTNDRQEVCALTLQTLEQASSFPKLLEDKLTDQGFPEKIYNPSYIQQIRSANIAVQQQQTLVPFFPLQQQPPLLNNCTSNLFVLILEDSDQIYTKSIVEIDNAITEEQSGEYIELTVRSCGSVVGHAVQNLVEGESQHYHSRLQLHPFDRGRSLEQYLGCSSKKNLAALEIFLQWAEFSNNTVFHLAIKMSPFRAVCGRASPSLLDYFADSSSNEDVDLHLQQHQQNLHQWKENLQRTQKRMKWTTDRRKKRQIEVGDLLLVKLHPYKQFSVKGQPYVKLAKRFYGPFTIFKRIDAVAYKDQLPEFVKIYSVFHVYFLKKFKEDAAIHVSQLLADFVDERPVLQSLSILNLTWITIEGIAVLQLLVQWVGTGQLYVKLAKCFYGPFRILKRIGEVAYKVELPVTAKIHSVFHVSVLKLFREDVEIHVSQLPVEFVDDGSIVQPLSILNNKWVTVDDVPVLQILVQWVRLPLEETSWEILKDFQTNYPSFNLEDKVCLPEVSNVTVTNVEKELEERKTTEADYRSYAEDEERNKRIRKKSLINDCNK